MPYFLKIGQSDAKILRFFDFSRWQPLPPWIVEFAKFYWLTESGLWRSQTLNCTKFCRNGCSVAEILQFFEYSRWPTPPSWIFEIAKFYWLVEWRGSRRISMPNFIKIGQPVANILSFFDFSGWRRPPFWIVEFANLLANVSGGPRCITEPNFVNIGRSVAEILHFSNFQDGRHCHLGLFKFYWLLG